MPTTSPSDGLRAEWLRRLDHTAQSETREVRCLDLLGAAHPVASHYGLLCWWAALGGRRPTTRARIGASWRMGWVLGAAGLALGFFGPLVITPKANLGPLLGVLITGPGGFVLGALGANDASASA